MVSKEEKSAPEAEPSTGPGTVRSLPRVGVLESVRRHKLLAATPLILLIAGAFAYSFLTDPTYTAESYQSIGRLDVNEPGTLSGFQQATETLAITYARAIRSTSVVNDVSEKTGLSTDEVRSRLGAYTIPESAVFVVAATGNSEDDAVELSLEGSAALQRYVRSLNSENPNADRLFREYRRATFRASQLRQTLVRRQRALGPNPTAAQRRALSRFEAEVAAAELRRDVTRVNYGDSQASQAAISVVQDLALAETADSDRFERLQIALFIAVSAGILLGLALATWRANRDVRRALSVS
jgi:uncharacterized protein involved in exopolysaccharide biosynthesis